MNWLSWLDSSINDAIRKIEIENYTVIWKKLEEEAVTVFI